MDAAEIVVGEVERSSRFHPNLIVFGEDFEIGPLAPGTHSFALVVDSTALVAVGLSELVTHSRRKTTAKRQVRKRAHRGKRADAEGAD